MERKKNDKCEKTFFKRLVLYIYISIIVGCVFASIIMYRMGIEVFSFENIKKIPEILKDIMR